MEPFFSPFAIKGWHHCLNSNMILPCKCPSSVFTLKVTKENLAHETEAVFSKEY